MELGAKTDLSSWIKSPSSLNKIKVSKIDKIGMCLLGDMYYPHTELSCEMPYPYSFGMLVNRNKLSINIADDLYK